MPIIVFRTNSLSYKQRIFFQEDAVAKNKRFDIDGEYYPKIVFMGEYGSFSEEFKKFRIAKNSGIKFSMLREISIFSIFKRNFYIFNT